MENLNAIGLDLNNEKKLTDKLNELLANYQLFYMNVRGFHWNIKGDKFFTLHVKFEELYTNLQLKIDELAERMLTLGHTPYHTYEDYLATSLIKEAKNITGANEAVKKVLDNLKIVLIKQRELMKLADDSADEGTSALMSDYIREQEKLVWMYNAFLS